MATDTNKNQGLDDQNSIINQGNQGSMQDGTNKSPILEDLNSIINQGNTGSKPEKDDDDNEIEKEIDTPSQPAEEHLITEADNLHNNDLEQNSDASSLEDPDQGPEEIDPINHPRDFQINPENKPKRPLVD